MKREDRINRERDNEEKNRENAPKEKTEDLKYSKLFFNNDELELEYSKFYTGPVHHYLH